MHTRTYSYVHAYICTYVLVVFVSRKLSDVNEDNALSEDEFCIAMKLVVARRKGIIIPPTLPSALRARPSSGE